MDIPRKLGILVFCGVPVIVGGGILYALSSSYTIVGVLVFLVYCTAGAFVSR